MVALLFADIVWEGTETEMTDALPGLRDGHFYKQLDTGESYFRRNGIWEFINLGLSFIKATKSGNLTTDGSGEAAVIFTTPFIDDQYSIALTCSDPGVGIQINAYVVSKSNTAFSVVTRRVPGGLAAANTEISWLCTRDYNP